MLIPSKVNLTLFHIFCTHNFISPGNEDDYIIISAVRTRELGFLRNKRRTNVMLTRCKRGMFICSNRPFLEKEGAHCLVGELAAEFGEKGWVDMKELDEFLLEL